MFAGLVGDTGPAHAAFTVARTCGRRWAVARRWAHDRRACSRCGHDVLWRWEWPPSMREKRRVALDRLGREHACP